MRMTRRTARAAATVLVAALVLAACGADTDTPTGDVDEPDEAADGPVEAPIETGPERHLSRRPRQT